MKVTGDDSSQPVSSPVGDGGAAPALPFPEDLNLVPVSRWPTTLPNETVQRVLATPVDRPGWSVAAAAGTPRVSIVVVTFDSLVFTRLCLESLLAARRPHFEVIVVDNGSKIGRASCRERVYVLV